MISINLKYLSKVRVYSKFKRQILGVFSFLLFLVSIEPANAGPPFFCEKASYFESGYLFAVGVSEEATEAEARNVAFINAKQELRNYFQNSSADLKIETQRMYTEKRGNKIYACRLVKVNIESINASDFGFKTPNIIGSTDALNFYEVKILTKPSKATLLINNEVIGATDAILQKVSAGRHRVIIQKEGYESVVKELEINQNSVFTFELKLRRSSVTINKNVNNSKIYVNGKLSSESNNRTEIISLPILSNYTIRIEADGYEPEEKSFYIAGNELSITKDFNLVGLPGEVTIATEPMGAQVYLNDVFVGKSPVKFTQRPGEITYRVELEGFKTKSNIFTLMPKENKKIDLVILDPELPADVESKKKWHVGVELSTTPNYLSGFARETTSSDSTGTNVSFGESTTSGLAFSSLQLHFIKMQGRIGLGFLTSLMNSENKGESSTSRPGGAKTLNGYDAAISLPIRLDSDLSESKNLFRSFLQLGVGYRSLNIKIEGVTTGDFSLPSTHPWVTGNPPSRSFSLNHQFAFLRYDILFGVMIGHISYQFNGQPNGHDEIKSNDAVEIGFGLRF